VENGEAETGKWRADRTATAGECRWSLIMQCSMTKLSILGRKKILRF